MIYWSSTTLLAVFLLWSSYSYAFSQATIVGVRALGFPDFFRWQLLVLKLIAVVILLAPAIPVRVKEWAYAGVGLFLITAIVAHIAHKDSWFITAFNVALFGLLMVSNSTLMRS